MFTLPVTRSLKPLALIGVLFIAGCAGNPPTAQFALTSTAVKAAETAGANEYAPLQLKAARDKTRLAEQANFEQDYMQAKNLAEQAEWDARVAERKARAAKAEKAVMDAEKGVEELRQEGMRISE